MTKLIFRLKNNEIKLCIILFLFAFFLGCKNHDGILKIPDSPYPISEVAIKIDTIAEGFFIPYGIEILGETEYFITDRQGSFFHFKDGTTTEVTGVPKVLTFGDPGIPFILHGGLMDVSKHPKYPDNPWVYISYLSEKATCKVDRFQIQDNHAIKFETIFETRTSGYYGNGTRIVWEDDAHFFLNVGGSTISTISNPITIAQDFQQDWGKIHRLNADGSIPIDNPILDGLNAPTTIWSYGHRDAQGLYYDKTAKVLFACEHGPKGGDEFNIIVKGGNYGWPLFSYGIDYSGIQVSTIPKDSAATFTVLPEHYWTVPTNDGGQAIAPACLLKVEGSTITDWNTHFLIGSLAYRRLFKYNRDTGITTALPITGRVRTVKQLPSGAIIALIERDDLSKSNGKIVRISKQ